MDSMIGLSFVIGTLFILFQFRGVMKKEAKAMEAEATANYHKRYVKAVIKANKTYQRVTKKDLLTLDEIEARLEGDADIEQEA